MLLRIAPIIATTLCILLALVRIRQWFSLQIGPENGSPGVFERMRQGFAGVRRKVLSRKILPLLGTLVTKILLQTQLLRQSPWRWLAHGFVFYGILILVVFHALDDVTSRQWFGDYQSTLNPFRFMRELLGVLALIGIGMALWRRQRHGRIKSTSNRADMILLLLLALILISGFAVESASMISEPVFDEMVADYWGEDDPAELAPLKALWTDAYGVVFAAHPVSLDPQLILLGAQLNAESCSACHSPASAAFVSRPATRLLRPWAAWLNAVRADIWLYYFHYLVSLLALVVLPVSKLFHLVATPLSLFLQEAGHPASHTSANRLTRRALALSACTHCGECSRLCSVAPIYDVIQNNTILPSEKLAALSALNRDKGAAPADLLTLAEGSFICTECYRCTQVCPAGIHLQDLWQASKAHLTNSENGNLHQRVRRYSATQWHDALQADGSTANPPTLAQLSDDPHTFRFCVQCSVCTNVCPVVAASANPEEELDMTPQQVMNMLRLQLKEMTYGARMVWDCVTCYMCQEHCPQHIRVADILYELRNEACCRLPGLATGCLPAPSRSRAKRGKKDLER